MPADLPALARLTEDVVAAMHAAEAAQRRRRRWRREFPLAVVLLALLIPAGLGLRAALGGGHDAPRHDPPVGGAGDHAPGASRAGHDGAHAVARACGAGVGALAATGLTLRAVRAAGGAVLLGPARGVCA